MADGDADKTFTQEQYAAMVAERDAVIANRDTILGEAKEAKETARAAKEALLKFDDVDLDELKRLRKAEAEAERTKARDAGDWDRREAQLAKEHEAQMAEVVGLHNTKVEGLEAENKGLRGDFQERFLHAEAVDAISAAGGRTKVLLPHIESQLSLIKGEDGKHRVRVVDAEGKVRIGGDQGLPMTIGQLVGEVRDDEEFMQNFDGTGSSGGGASKSSAGGGGTKVVAAGDEMAFMSNVEGIASGEVTVK